MEDSILKAREENAIKYQRTFLGCEMIDWLIKEGETANRKEAIELGRALLEHGIIQHGTWEPPRMGRMGLLALQCWEQASVHAMQQMLVMC